MRSRLPTEKINFADASAVGGINIVRFDKGGQALNVQANNFSGELGSWFEHLGSGRVLAEQRLRRPHHEAPRR